MASLSITRRDGSTYAVLLDDEDYERVVAAGPWHVKTPRCSNTAYVAHHPDGRRGGEQSLHRFLLSAGPGTQVDHKNGDGLDNRRQNLRFATRAQNLQNRSLQRHNTSGCKGVTWHAGVQKWQAQIGANGRYRYLGLYSVKEAAAAAYQHAAQQLHGDFARKR